MVAGDSQAIEKSREASRHGRMEQGDSQPHCIRAPPGRNGIDVQQENGVADMDDGDKASDGAVSYRSKPRSLPGFVDEEAGRYHEKLEKEDIVLTEKQESVLRAYQRHKTLNATARAIGRTAKDVRKCLDGIKRRSGISEDMTLHLIGEVLIENKQRQHGVTAGGLRQMLEDQEYRCALSGVELTPETLSVDHKVPISKGGAHDMGKVWLVNRDVNRAKGTMTTEEFVAMCRRVSGYAS